MMKVEVVDLNDLARSNGLDKLAVFIPNALVQAADYAQEEHALVKYETYWDCLCRYTDRVAK